MRYIHVAIIIADLKPTFAGDTSRYFGALSIKILERYSGVAPPGALLQTYSDAFHHQRAPAMIDGRMY